METRQASRDLESAHPSFESKTSGHATRRGCAPGTPPAPPAARLRRSGARNVRPARAPRPRPRTPRPPRPHRPAFSSASSVTTETKAEHVARVSSTRSTPLTAYRTPRATATHTHPKQKTRRQSHRLLLSRVPVRRLERAHARACGSRAPHDLSAGALTASRSRLHARRPAAPAGNAGEPATARSRLVSATPPAGVAGASSRVADTSANELRVPRGRDTPRPPPPRAATTRSVGRASEPRERLASFVSPPPPPPAGTETRRASGDGSNESTTAPSPTAPAARSTPSGYLRRSRDRAAPRRLAPGDTGPTLRASEASEAASPALPSVAGAALPRLDGGRRPAARRSRPRRRRRRRSADRARARRRASPRPCARCAAARNERSRRSRGRRRRGRARRRLGPSTSPSRRARALVRRRRPRRRRARALFRDARRKSTRPTATHARVSIMVARSVSRRVIGKKPSLSSAEPLAFSERSSETNDAAAAFSKENRSATPARRLEPPAVFFAEPPTRAWPRRRVWPRRRTPRHSP